MNFELLKTIFRGTAFWAYFKYFRKRFFPSQSQREEDRLTPGRLSFYKEFIKAGDLCFDVGANIGNRTEVFLALNAKVVAIEPQQDCARFLKLRFGRRIDLLKIALGETEGQGLLYISETSEISSLSRNWIDSVSKFRFKEKKWSKKSQVEISTLDKLIEKYGVPEFCKIDVEGYEAEVLKGLSQPIRFISFEYTIPEMLENVLRCLEQLARIGSFTCNYTVGENMRLELIDWISKEELYARISRISSRVLFGDIYVRFDKV